MKIQKVGFWDSWIPETEWEAKYLIENEKDITIFFHGVYFFFVILFALAVLGIIAIAKFRGGF